MRYLKMIGLGILAAAALTAIVAGSASATELTCAASTMCSTNTTLHTASEGKVVFDLMIGAVECDSVLEGTTTNTGSSTETVSGVYTVHTYSNCNAEHVDVLKKGTFEIHTHQIVDDNNGTLTSSDTEVTIEYLGFHCIIATKNTHIGTITGSANTGSTATLDLEGTTLPRTGGRSGAFCGTEVHLTGSYKIDTPMVLNVH